MGICKEYIKYRKYLEQCCENYSIDNLQKLKKEKLQKDILELIDNYIKDSYYEEIKNISEPIITETCEYINIITNFPTIKNYLYQTECNYFIGMEEKNKLILCPKCNRKIYYK